MATQSILLLREVAERLGRVQNLPKKKLPISELLSALKAGELRAGFFFPAGDVIWIPIPQRYWADVKRSDLRSVRFVEGDKRQTGSFLVRITDFVDEYINIISQKVEKTIGPKDVLKEMKVALSSAAKSYEVGVLAEEWQKYLNAKKLHEVHPRETRGRHPKSSWHHIAPIMASYMMTLDRSLDQQSIAKTILECAEKDGIGDLPSPETLADAVSKALDRAKKLKDQGQERARQTATQTQKPGGRANPRA